jgi:sarcosine oxidase delta subunit
MLCRTDTRRRDSANTYAQRIAKMRQMYGIQMKMEEEKQTRLPVIEHKKSDSSSALSVVSLSDSKDSARTITPLPPISPNITQKKPTRIRSTASKTTKAHSTERHTDLNTSITSSNKPSKIDYIFKEDHPASHIIEKLNHTQNLQQYFKASYNTSEKSEFRIPSSPNTSGPSVIPESPAIKISPPEKIEPISQSNSYVKYSSAHLAEETHEEIEEEMDEVKGLLEWVQELPDEMSSDMSGNFHSNGIVI